MKRPQLAVALDFSHRDEALRAAEALRGRADIAKVGLELFVGAGPGIVEELRADGWSVFLDLKLHDIPATVAGAVRAAAALGVDFLTLHASGGRTMIEAAARAREGSPKPLLLGVSVLTSLNDAQIDEIGLRGGVAHSVRRLAALARVAGCDGVVSSPLEVAEIKAAHGADFLVAAPGIRPATGAANDDQQRVATVADAVAAGADVLVVGRPILKAADPVAAAAVIRGEMERAYAQRN